MNNSLTNVRNAIIKLDDKEKKQLFVLLRDLLGYSTNISNGLTHEIRESKFKDGLYCPHCNCKYIVRYGKYNGIQRYKCKDCGKTFTEMSFTPINKTHYPEKWITFIECMIEGFSLRKSADIVGITWVTLFYWRHKILSALKQIPIEHFEGIVEVDKTYFLYSQKGQRHITNRKPRKRGGSSKYRGISHEQVCVLVARDREKNTVSKVTCMGRILTTQVENTIGQYLSEDNILCTDSWRAYMTYAKDKGLEHYRIKSDGKSHVIKGIYHIQNVNSYHQRLKKWLGRFNGVASKYLDDYLSWFRFLDRNGFEDNDRNIRNMIISSCGYKTNETYKTLRLSKFTV